MARGSVGLHRRSTDCPASVGGCGAVESPERQMNRYVATRYSLIAVLGLVIALALGLGPDHSASVLAAPTSSSRAQITQPPIEGGGPDQPIDVVVVLDDSGSMATCWPWPREEPPFFPPCRSPSPNLPSDPDELRYSAARLLLQLADAEDRVAVVRFDTIAEGVGALGSLQRSGEAGSRRQLTDTLQPPTDYFRRGYTRVDLGLEMAADLLIGAREPGRDQYILLLTDGEPSQPDGTINQRERVSAQIETLRGAGILTFPVVLCNPSAGCAGDFLREQFADFGVREAATAQELLRVFSELFTNMKSDRSVITNRNTGGILELSTRVPHGVRSIAFVTAHNGLTSVRRDDEPMLTRSALNDPNIDVNTIDTANLGSGRWTAETSDGSGFAVVQADSYPQLLNPPPSIANSPASVRYYPAGKPPLLIARSVGPGAAEPLLYNNQIVMDGFGQDNARALLPSDEPTAIRLQLGEDKDPLQLVRSFRLEPRADLPHLEIFSPRPDDPGLLDDGHVRLQVSFGGGANVNGLAASALVFEGDETGSDGSTKSLAHQINMNCVERVCTDDSFQPVDGHNYQIFYVLQGQMDDIRFSDWGEAHLELEPAVYLRGLPAQLDLTQMPEDGWPIELTSGTLEEIGMLSASITLYRGGSEEAIQEVSLDFMQDVPEEGILPATLMVRGLDSLRPGQYSGEIRLEVASPSGLPMDVRIRPAPVIPVTLSVARPTAYLQSQVVDFGEVLFDTSPNFRLDQAAHAPISFEGRPFKITARLQSTTCDDLNVVSGDIQRAGSESVLPLQLSSTAPVPPSTCSGTVVFSGPDADYDVVPAQLDWQTRVASVEWSIVSNDLDLGDLQDAGARIEETILVRFSGKTPFLIQLADLVATGSNSTDRDTAAAPILSAEHIDMPPVEVSGVAREDGIYAVPLTLIARQAIPKDPLRGTFYSGQMTLSIAGLEGDPKQVDFGFRSPTLYQRYIAPIVVPIYSMPWMLCTVPLTLMLLLVLVARLRSRGFNDAEIEEAAVAATMQMSATDPAAAASEQPFLEPAVAGHSPQTASMWGTSEWGSVWGAKAEVDETVASGYSPKTNGAANGGDPWASSW